MSANSSRNAVKHGLSSLHHMPKGREHELPPIEAELMLTRQPETPEQREIVQELAFAMWQRAEAERTWAEQAAPRYVDAEALYKKTTEARAAKLLEQYQKHPLAHYDELAASLAGVKHFVQVWTNFMGTLADGATPPSMKQAMAAVRSMGMESSPLTITGEGELLMKQVLALKPNPDKSIGHWHSYENFDGSSESAERVKAIREKLPNAGVARAELRKCAEKSLAYWKAQVPAAAEREAQAKLQFIDNHQYDLVTAEEHEVALGRIQRYLSAASNKVKDLNRRLDNLKAAAARQIRHDQEMEHRKQQHDLRTGKLAKMLAVEIRNELYQELKDLVLDSQNLYTMPDDWEKHTPILHTIMPTKAMFNRWSDLQLEKSAPGLIEFLESNENVDRNWLRDVKHLLSLEIHHRKEMDARRKAG